MTDGARWSVLLKGADAGSDSIVTRRSHHAFPCNEVSFEREREMETSKLARPTTARQELEESWGLRLKETLNRYHTVTEAYRKVLAEQSEGLPPSPEGSIGRARQAKSEALAEYRRVLHIFTDLTIHGKLPAEQSGNSDGGL